MHVLVALFIQALVLLYAPAQAAATPTMCEFIAIEVMDAVDRGTITYKEGMDILSRCDEGRFDPST